MQGETNSTIKIENNVLIFGSTVLQLSNICNFEVKPRPKKKYPTIAIILILIGIGFFLVEETITFGIILLLIGVLIIITIAAENNSRGKYLIITMNSGNNFLFYCKEDSFLYDASNEIAKRIDRKGKSEINFQNCNITSSQVGSDNSQFIGGTK